MSDTKGVHALQAAHMTKTSQQGKGHSSKLHLGSPAAAAAAEDIITAKLLDGELDRPASEHFAPDEVVVV